MMGLMVARGVSMIEIMVVIGIISLIAVLGLPAMQNFGIRQDVPVAARDMLHALRRAQIRSVLSEAGSNVGVRVTAGTSTTLVIFQGSSYDTRNVEVDESYQLPATVGLSYTFAGGASPTDIIFSRQRGKPSDTGTFFLYAPGGVPLQITVGAEGLISQP